MNQNPEELSDTIVALSTPPGRSAIGLIRMSGPEALAITKRVFRLPDTKDLHHRLAVYGQVIHPESRQILDDGVVVFMRGPHSYTGEDLVEIGLHGSPLVLETVVRILTQEGARLAERGEFTRRAFLAGKMDLMQAEAVIDLIEAHSLSAAQEARVRLDSSMMPLKDLSDALKDNLALIEAHIDFDEDDEYQLPDVLPAIRNVLSRMETVRRYSEKALIIRKGIQVCIAGKPNVGKSTLFNALLRNERTIVSPIPGTTRDTVEDRIILGSHALALWDTAGVRESGSIVENEGIKRTLDTIEKAHLVVAVVDGTTGIDQFDEAILKTCTSKNLVLVVNKMDLVVDGNAMDSLVMKVERPTAFISAKTGQGMAALEDLLVEQIDAMTSCGESEGSVALNSRCLQLLNAASAPLERIRNLFGEGVTPSPEIIAYEIRCALSLLEEMTGERVDDGVLDRIFERFCVGK
ncbi:MAG: tRNA modification GTPase [Thermodesulfobacteriota bacterium]|nr:tRNA modification GTPase [Thermodesulfobacteriota bacterium]